MQRPNFEPPIFNKLDSERPKFIPPNLNRPQFNNQKLEGSNQNTKEKKYDIFKDLCKNLLNCIPDEYPIINKNSSNKTLIVESRWNKVVEYTIKNTIQKMGDNWGHIIICNNDNFNEIIKLKEKINPEIEIINLGDFKIDRNSYNNMFYDYDFWDKLNCDKVLIYQSDTLIFKEFDNSFLEWDYIGAPWIDTHSKEIANRIDIESGINVGNGGLSLRNVKVMKKIILQETENKNSIKFKRPSDLDFLHEDAFFSYLIGNSSEFKLAPIEIAKKFSFEHEYYDDTFGCHQPFIDAFSGVNMMSKITSKIKGINVYGIGNTNSGLGHNMRMIVEALKLAKIPYNVRIMNPNSTKSNKESYFDDKGFDYFGINLILNNPYLNKNFEKNIDFKNKYNIGLWAWELEQTPQSWIDVSIDFGEIWTISEFCKNIFKKDILNKTIRRLNIPGEWKTKKDKVESKKELSIENKFIVLFTFDALSDLERKNPESIIEAFNKSLSKYSDCMLIIKTHNLNDIKRYQDKVKFLNNISSDKILIINETWTSKKMETLFNAADIYISLHRSEGSGLTLMESIMLEIPTICTGWSGNMDFCQPGQCELVDYEMIEIGVETFYNKYFDNKPKWANPSVDQAAEKLEKIYNNYEHYVELIKLNKEFIKENYSVEELSSDILRILNEIKTE